MKKALLLLLLCACLAALGATTFTSKSLLFADSFMLRAKGCEANYWNPALLNENTHDLWIPALNTGIFLGNNSLNLDLYNYIMDREYLTAEDKQHIMDAIDNKIAFEMGGQIGIFGITFGNVALSSSIHMGARSAFSEEYLQLLLYGNGDGSQVYEFTEEENYLEALSYTDITIGVGDIKAPLPEKFPPIRFGFAGSLLGGIGNAHTEDLYGMFSSNLDGLTVQQDVLLRTGAAGYGFKGMVGMVIEPIPFVKAGITLDNIFGFINWGLVRQDLTAHFAIDSLYAIDIQDDFYEYDYSRTKGDPYTTKLPLELRLSGMFHTNQVSFTADYVKGFDDGAEVSKQGRFALGVELKPLPFIQVHLGYGSGNDNYPWRVAYGIGLNLKAVEFGLGIQSIENFLPGSSSKGIAFGNYFNIRI